MVVDLPTTAFIDNGCHSVCATMVVAFVRQRLWLFSCQREEL